MGVENIINFCLGIVKDDSKSQKINTQIIEDFQMIGKSQQVEYSFGDRVRGFFGGGGNQAVPQTYHSDLYQNSIFEKFSNIIVSCLYCWNDLPIFLPRDYCFSRGGMYAYTSQDEKLIAQMVEKLGEKEKENFEEYIKANTNPIQKNIIEFL
mmetsp:Transcript_39177/g.37563  ORF Transcript_39177/g.37563 Transcript_39177/m.37563 type:complete len:152 (-) Transcript_39177:1959-2414(-)